MIVIMPDNFIFPYNDGLMRHSNDENSKSKYYNMIFDEIDDEFVDEETKES